MQKYYDSVITTTGRPLPGVLVSLENYPAGTPVTLYSDDGITPITGSLSTDYLGYFEFYVGPGQYNLVLTVSGVVSKRIIDVSLGDSEIIASLIATGATQGAALVAATQSTTYPAGTLGRSFNQYPSIHDAPFNAVGDGTTLDDAAFAAAAALGRTIMLTPGKTYYLSARVNCVTGTRFVCLARCTVKIKTGTGGFNNTTLATKDPSAVFFFSGTDDNAVEGISFTTDVVKEVIIYPIRVLGGMGTTGIRIERIKMTGLSLSNGGYISLNSVGAGAYRVRDIEALNCGTAQGNTYWTGSFAQITVFEVDNDLVGGVQSEPGYAANIRGTNILLTGQALTDYTQQTDIVNIAGSNASERKGPRIEGVYADGVGEVIDLFCRGAVITGVRARNVHLFVAKFINGARQNHVVVDECESSGLAVCVFGGSATAPQHCEGNVCDILSVVGVGDVGSGPAAANAAVVAFYENGGAIGTSLPRNNVANVTYALGTANFDNVVYDNCTVQNSNGNRVNVVKAIGYTGAFCSVQQFQNTKVRYTSAQACRLTMAANSTLASATDVTLPYDTAAVPTRDDPDSLLQTTNKIRPKFPGWYQINVGTRLQTPAAATDYVIFSILKNASVVLQKNVAYGSTLVEACPSFTTTVYVAETEVGTTNADYSIRARHVAAGATSITATNAGAFAWFEMIPVSG